MKSQASAGAGRRRASLSFGLTALANVALGFVTLLPAAFVVLAVSALVLGEVSTDYNSDPSFYRSAGILCGVLIAALFLGLNAGIQHLLPGRQRWLWLIAAATYPIPYLVDLWSSR